MDRNTCLWIAGLTLAFAAMACDRGATGDGATTTASGPGVDSNSSSQSILLQADALVLQGRTDEAIALANGILTPEPNEPGAHRLLGQAYAARDDLNLAGTHLERALEINPNDDRALSTLADVKARGGDPGAAIHLYGRFLELRPDDLITRLALGRLLLDAGRVEEAAPHIEAAAERPSAAAYTSLGRLRVAQDRGDQAETALRQAIDIDRLDVEALQALGQHLIESGREIEGRAVLEHQADVSAALDQVKFYENSSRMAGASSGNLVLLGQALLAAGEIQKAADLFGSAVQSDPDSADAALSLAEVYALNGETDAATQWIVHALRVTPEDGRAHRDMAVARIIEGQADLAAASIDRSQRAGEWDVEDHRLIGKAYLKADMADLAHTSFTAALAIGPDDVELLVLDGMARLPNDPEGSAAAFSRARELRPYLAGPAMAHGVALYLLDDPEAGDAAFIAALERRVPGDAIIVGIEMVREWLSARPGVGRPVARFAELEASEANPSP